MAVKAMKFLSLSIFLISCSFVVVCQGGDSSTGASLIELTEIEIEPTKKEEEQKQKQTIVPDSSKAQKGLSAAGFFGEMSPIKIAGLTVGLSAAAVIAYKRPAFFCALLLCSFLQSMRLQYSGSGAPGN